MPPFIHSLSIYLSLLAADDGFESALHGGPPLKNGPQGQSQ
jgi:hypothetical protein